jgi:hypothetical protein
MPDANGKIMGTVGLQGIASPLRQIRRTATTALDEREFFE